MPAEPDPPTGFREHTRAPLEVPAEIQLDAFSDPLTGHTANVSVGGLFVRLKDPPPVGTVVRFKLDLGPEAGTVQGTGEVVWIRTQGRGGRRPAGIGVQFRYVGPDGARRLRAAVEEALAVLGPEPDEPPRRKPRPTPSPPAPARPDLTTPAARGRHAAPEAGASASSSKKAADDRQWLGLPAEKVKVALLVLLFGVLALVVLL